MNPVFFIFCEGETEEEYCKLLRQHFRFAIQIKTKITGLKISDGFIQNYLADVRKDILTTSDKIFLLFDADAPDIMRRLLQIKGAELLITNPCVELWFLLHYRNQTAFISTQECLAKLKSLVPGYKKGTINLSLATGLEENTQDATNRAKNLKHFENPSSTIYLLIDEIQSLKKGIHSSH